MKVRRTITLEVDSNEDRSEAEADDVMAQWVDALLEMTPRNASMYPIAPALSVVDAARHTITQWDKFDGNLLTDDLESALQGLRAAIRVVDVLEGR